MGARLRLICSVLVLTCFSGCGLDRNADESTPSAQSIAPDTASIAATNPSTPASSSLPFKGRLVDGSPDNLPPTVAQSLSPDSPITFSYREELTHDDYHIPLIISALDPVTYVGAPLGDIGVTVFATLTIFDHNRVIGDYTAKTHISRSYTLYHEPTHREVEQAARVAVRDKIDAKLAQDSNRLAAAVKEAPATAASERSR